MSWWKELAEPVVMDKEEGNWWESAVPINRQQALVEAQLPDVRTDLAADPYPNVGAGWTQATAGAFAPFLRELSRLSGKKSKLGQWAETEADRMQAKAAAFSRASGELSEQRTSYPVVPEAFRGVVATLPTAAAAGRLGGPFAALGQAGLSERDSSYFEAKQQGMPEHEAQRHGNISGVIEFGVGAVFQKLGQGGLEERLGGQGVSAVRQGAVDALKKLGIDFSAELVEELTTEAMHSVNSQLSGVDPAALSPESLWHTAQVTTLQTAMTMGLVGAPSVAMGVDNDLQRIMQPRPQHDLGEFRARLDKIQEEYVRQQSEQKQRRWDAAENETVRQVIDAQAARAAAEREAAGAEVSQLQRAEAQAAERHGWEQQAQQAAEEEQRLYREFYGDPQAAVMYAQRFPEQAKKLAGLKQYTPQAFQEADPDLPALAGTPYDAALRRQFRDRVKRLVEDPRGALPPAEPGWTQVPEGTQIPDHPSIERRETVLGTYVRIRPPKMTDTVSPKEPSDAVTQEPAAQEGAGQPSLPEARPGDTEGGRGPQDDLPGAPQEVPGRGEEQVGPDEYADTPRTRKLREVADGVRGSLPPVPPGHVRLWRGNRSGGRDAGNPRYTNSLEGIALPFKEAYGGPLTYVDVPSGEVDSYMRHGAVARGAEFFLPEHIASAAKEVPEDVFSTEGAPDAKPQAETSPEAPAEAEARRDVLSPSVQLAQAVRDRIARGEQIVLFPLADESFGGTRGQGKYGDSEAYDAQELGVNLHLLGGFHPTVPADGARSNMTAIKQIERQIAKHQARTGEKDTLQQFSTPPAYAYVTAWAANLSDQDVVLEPSAGTGGLAVHAINAGAKVYANEIDPKRAELLRELPLAGVFTEDAEHIGGSLRGKVAPTAIIMNPPFSRAGHRLGNKKIIGTDRRHIDEALKLLAPGGRLVAIIGAGLHGRGQAFGQWLENLPYQVRADIEVSRDVYKAHGTTFPTRLLVIDKVPRDNSPRVQGEADTLSALIDMLAEVRNARPEIQREPAQQPGQKGFGPRRPAGRPDEAAQPPTGGVAPRPEVGGGAVAGQQGQGGDAGVRPGDADVGSGESQAGDAVVGRPGSDAGGRGARPGGKARPRLGGKPGGRSAGAPAREPGADRPGGESAPGRPAGLDDISADDLIDEVTSDLLGQTPELERVDKPPFAPKSQGVRESKPKTKLQESAEKARQDADQIWEELAKRLKQGKATAGLDPELARLVAMGIVAEVKAGTLSFAAMVESLAGKFGEDFVRSIGPNLRQAWDGIKSRHDTQGQMSESEDVDGLLASAKPEHVAAEGRKELGESVYEPYRPSVRFEGAKPHPGSIVESAPMAAVKPPRVAYTPKIPKKVIDGYVAESGAPVGISDVQLEVVAMAGQAHEQHLPDGTRRGFMIGDGTGVGKAREIAGILLDNWNRGRRKAVWVSKNSDLFEPAQDEWERIGGDRGKLFQHSKVSSGDSVSAKDGILFTTYATVAQGASSKAAAAGRRLSRVDQIAQWFGEDYDGVIVFDESHKMGNAIDGGGQGRQRRPAAETALKAVELQNKMPQARVVYLSATAASEVSNLAYGVRLGLWGDGTSFPTREDFINAITAGGVAAMEKVAADMKWMGMYMARNLSFDDGTEKGRVEYDRIEHSLTDDQTHQWDTLAEAWQMVLGNVSQALGLTEGGSQQSSQAMSQFWGANQRFWNQIITSMKIPSLVQAIENDLAAGKSVLVQLTSTNKADQDRALANKSEDEEFEDLDLSPKRILIDFVETGFPTQKWEEYTDDEGNVRTRPVVDSEGNPVHDPEAVALKEKLLEELASLQVANRGALDQIIDHFGSEMVAEMTSRNERLVTKEGRLEREPRGKRATKDDRRAFMDGRKRVLVFSEAGGTGASYHADLNSKNQQKREHYLLQPGWRADVAIQGLGRSHRSNQAQAPRFHLVSTNLKGEKRFISTIARRLAQLGALTKGERKAGESGIFKPTDNLESPEATGALHDLFREVFHGKVEEVSLQYLSSRMGLTLVDSQGYLKKDLPPITQFFNRVLNLPIDEQNRMFELFEQRFMARVDAAIANGTLDQGMETFKADKVVKVRDEVAYTHKTGAEARYVQLTIYNKTKPKTWDQVQNAKVVAYLHNAASGAVWVAEDTGTSDQDDRGRLVKKYRLVGPTSVQYTTADKLDGKNWRTLDDTAAERLWNEAVEKVPEFSERPMHLITGVLLPIWDRLPTTQTQVKRLLTEDGELILGRVIEEGQIQTVLRNLGLKADTPTMSAEQAVDAVLDGRVLSLANGWKVKRSLLDGERIIVVVGPDNRYHDEFRRIGITWRRLGAQMRYILPTGERAAEVMGALLENRPVMSVHGGRSEQAMAAPAKKHPILRQPLSTEPRRETDTVSVSPADILKTWERMFGVPLRAGGFNRRAQGIYKILPEVIRMKEEHYGNLSVASHEVAHHIDKHTEISDKMQSHLQSEVAGLDYEPKGRVFEGFAEFLRMYLTEPDVEVSGKKVPGVSQVAPNFYKWFTEEWMPGNPRWGKAITDARSQAQQHADMSVFERIGAAIRDRAARDLDAHEHWKQRVRNAGDLAYRRWVDKFRGFEMVDEAAQERGSTRLATVAETAMVYAMTNRANATMALEKGVHNITDGKVLGDSLWSLRDYLKDGEYDEAIRYANSRHTIFMAAHKPGYRTNIDLEGAKIWVREIEGDPGKRERFEKFANGLAKFNNDLLKMMVDAGALGKKDYARIIKAYQGEAGNAYYFPLHRVRETERGFGGSKLANQGKPVFGRSRKGSARPIMDPFDATMARAMHFYQRAAHARVLRALVETMDPKEGGVEGLGFLMDRIAPGNKVTRGTVEQILGTLVEEGFVTEEDARAARIASRYIQNGRISEEDQKWFGRRHGLDPETAQPSDWYEAAKEEPDLLALVSIWKPDFTPSAEKATILVHDRNGNPVLYELDRFLYDTVMAMDEIQHHGFMKVFRQAAIVFNAGAVSLSARFGLKNILRDYFEYQGRARNVEGLKTLGKPWEMLGRYIGYKARQMAGQPADDVLIEATEELGGKLFSPLGQDIASRQRLRHRKLGRSAAESAFSLGNIRDLARSGIEVIQEAVAISDAPPRLAEAEAAAKSLGYEARQDGWYHRGQKVDSLPEHVRIKMMMAYGEATVNFKRMGAWGQYVNAYSAFFNATIQASYREWQQVKSLPKLGTGDKDARRAAARYMVYLAAVASASMIAWYLRHDDDDYREQEPWLKDQNWTWGANGKTYVTIPKPRDAGGLVANLMERGLDAWYHDDAEGVWEVAARHGADRIPDVGGGLARATVESFVAEYDYFRERSLRPDYLKDEPAALQYTPYTLESSKAIGKVTGPLLGVSPIQVEHFLSQSTGGAYRRLADSTEAAYQDVTAVAKGDSPESFGVRHTPLGAFLMNRHQARSIDDFYTEWERVKLKHRWDESQGKLTPDLTAQKNRLDDYGRLMTEIRRADERDLRGRRKFLYEPYLVGLARSALRREALETNVDPFHDTDLPTPVKAALDKFASEKAKAIIGEGMPQKAKKETTEEYAARVKSWDAGQKADLAWLREYRESPVVKAALERLRGSQSYRDLLNRKGQPTFTPGVESWDSHMLELRRWQKKVQSAERWLGEG